MRVLLGDMRNDWFMDNKNVKEPQISKENMRRAVLTLRKNLQNIVTLLYYIQEHAYSQRCDFGLYFAPI